MAKHENFTAERVTRFQCQPGKQQSIYWDGKTPGLGLRVTAAGAKSYIFEAWLHGKSCRITIGDVRTWTVGAAQTKATELKGMTDQGIDPRQVKAQQAAQAEAASAEVRRQAVTLGEIWAEYLEARRAKWSDRHLADHEAIAHTGGRQALKGDRLTEPGALASLLPLKLAQIDAVQVGAWLRDEAAKRPTQAALAFRLLRAFINWCNDTPQYAGIIPADACQSRKVREEVPRQTPKTDCLQREQLPGWFAAVRQIGNPVISAYLQALLITGSRRESLAELKWDDVDFRWNSITIKDKVESYGGQNGTRTIPLTPYVAGLLRDLKARNDTRPPKHRILRGKRIEVDLSKWQPSLWVFASSGSASGHIHEPRIQHTKACTIAGIDGLSLHGLRRSFKSLAEWTEMPVGITAQIMGHKPSATAEKHYSFRPLDLLRLWHTKYETWILEQAGVSQPAKDAQGLRVVSGNSKKAIL